MAEAITLQGRRVWLKLYPEGERALSLGVLAACARLLGVAALRPPPHPGGARAREVEARRLAQLHAQGVNVPAVLGQGKRCLVLADTGRSLAACLKESDDAGRDRLVRQVLADMVATHRGGACFGQPLPRNMTWDGTRVAFLDFEEDPLQVMDLAQAQARDWLLFGHGFARHYLARREALAALLAAAFADEPVRVRTILHGACRRLSWLGRVAAPLGRSGRELALAIAVLEQAARA